ncbi:uncharacterized protein LOC133307769 [Gastrolobium bilobum]|uniref:uncharacterized protein LOC133307769 n=1 Tax=Gastrolobium bilobum TaxID=150636 RepID=UPI002AB1D364|nr:uncharacterized protein LOC133307769 [Gastrolobium bilobum]
MAASDKTNTSDTERLTVILLNGRNYMPWKCAVTVALGGRSKESHLTNRAPAKTDVFYTVWKASDNQVLTWLFNSMEPDVYELFAYSDTASVAQHFGHEHNASRIFKLQQEIHTTHQLSFQSFIDYLGQLRKKWDELRQYRPTAAAVTDYVTREEQDRVFTLLAGIRPEYESLKRQIFMTSPFPSFTSVCNLIHQEETRTRAMRPMSPAASERIDHSAYHLPAREILLPNAGTSSSSTFISTPTCYMGHSGPKGRGKRHGSNRYHCDHCNKDGHSRERCWLLHPHLKKEHIIGANSIISQPSSVELLGDLQSTLGKLVVHLQKYLNLGTTGKSSDASHLVHGW